MRPYKSFDILNGGVITEIKGMEEGSEEITFTTIKGGISNTYRMWHDQDCCENVWLSDICGDIEDLLFAEVIHAEEREESGDSNWGTYTWTFYDIQTTKGCVNLRWVGESNGYYSESVNFAEI